MHKRTPFYLSKSGLLSALIAAMFAPHAFAVSAGRVDFAQGAVSATGSDGNPRTLNKGSEINSGDIITIGNGRAQIRFTDGGYLALQPNTVFKVDEYAFEGKSDGKEKGFFSLVKGGLRTISGTIGKANQQTYKLSTPTATIGIRGTAFSAEQTGEQLHVTVGQGRVSITNQNGSLTIGSGQSVIVNSPKDSPKMTDEKVSGTGGQTQQQQAQQQQQDQQQEQTASQTFVGGNQITSSGTPASLPLKPVLTTGPGFAIAYSYTPAGLQAFSPLTGVFDAGQTLTKFTDGLNTLDLSTGAAQESGGDGIIGWGRWIGSFSGDYPGGGTYSSTQGFNYVVGQPTPTANLGLGSNAVVTYNLVGATKPSTYNGSTIYSLGTFSGTATVTFSATPTLSFTGSIVDPTQSINYNLALLGTFSLSVSMPNATFNTSGVGTGSMSNANTSMNGLFAGTNGERLGIAYKITNFGAIVTTGAAAFKTP